MCCRLVAQGTPAVIPPISVGGGYMESAFASLDFAQKLLDEQRRTGEDEQKRRRKLLDSETVSPLDLDAPNNAIAEFNRGEELLNKEKPQQAVAHFQKAITAYPKFVSAHNNLGLAFQALDDHDRAKKELETAIQLDPKFAQPYLNLGRFELSQKDFPGAESNLQKAVSLRHADPGALTMLAYAENFNYEYRHVLDTTARVHAMPHKGFANVHYVAASAAIALKDFDAVERELKLFLEEDPSNPLAPSATYNLKVLASNKASMASANQGDGPSAEPGVTQQVVKTFPNSDALKHALATLDPSDEPCADCSPAVESASATPEASPAPAASVADTPVPITLVKRSGVWRIRDTVDEVAVFFSVTNRSSIVNGLEGSDLAIRDDGQAPDKVLQFAPQSKLPLHLGLLIDTSGSLSSRFDFEKKAASRFLSGILRNQSDLAFVAGFANDVNVTQDFTGDTQQLTQAIDKLAINGGTAIWDAVSLACWKLAGLPESERVAKVLVVLTDGEDNASHLSLKRAIQDAESTGVTIYTISTREYADLHKFGMSDADKVLEALSERTGGEALFPGELSALDKSFGRLRDVIRSRYLVAYRPANFRNDGHFRKISIVASKNGKHLKVHARDGYYASVEAKN